MTAPSLAELQRAFLAAIHAAGTPDDARLAIYRRNALGNLHDALAAAYPVVRRLVGEAFFREAAAQFALAHPSLSGDLNCYGSELAPFLEGYRHARHLAYLPDVARLEWLRHEAYHALDGGEPDFEALARVPSASHGRVRFRLHPAVRLLESAHPVVAIWEANQAGRDGTPDDVQGPDLILVSRRGLQVRQRRVSRGEWALLHALRAGVALEEAAERVGGHELDAALRRLVEDGAIDGFTLDE